MNTVIFAAFSRPRSCAVGTAVRPDAWFGFRVPWHRNHGHSRPQGSTPVGNFKAFSVISVGRQKYRGLVQGLFKPLQEPYATSLPICKNQLQFRLV